MIILSNGLTDKIDEGCLKVVNSLTKRIKERYPETTIISYERQSQQSDYYLKLNKFFLNRSLLSLIKEKKAPVLYIPFSSNTTASVLRTWILSRYAKYGLKVIFVLRYPMNGLTKRLLKSSGAEVIALSRESYEFFGAIVGDKATYLKTGVDTKKFVPADVRRKAELRGKYAVAQGKKVLLHVGHLKDGRNVEQLCKVSSEYHVFLVVSSVTKDEQNEQLRNRLNARPNTTIIDSYIPQIEEVYQMADVYLFPVLSSGNCIDVPLSVMEAAACNVPVVTTKYGELKELDKSDGFYFIDSFEAGKLNQIIDTATMKASKSREAILNYDWDYSITHIVGS